MAYTRKITPLMGERHWPLKDLPLDPPPIKIGPERPKQIEQKILKDPKSSQDRFQMYFSICKSGDHTKKKCTTRTNHIEEPQPKQEGGQRNNFHILITLMHHIMKLLLNLVMEAGGEDEIEGEIKAGEREIKTEEMFMEIRSGIGVLYNNSDGNHYIRTPSMTRPLSISQGLSQCSIVTGQPSTTNESVV